MTVSSCSSVVATNLSSCMMKFCISIFRISE